MDNFATTKLPVLLTCSSGDLRSYPEYALATRLDWRKVPRFLSGEWPKKWPGFHMLGESAKADSWWGRLAKQADYLVVDVETEQLPDGSYSGKIIQVGLYPAGGTPAIWDREKHTDFNFTAVYRTLINSVRAVFQNCIFDIARIKDNFGVGVWEYVAGIEDTILMHHLRWVEHPHGLEFLQSVYSDYIKVKHLGVGSYEYLVGDIVGTAEVFDALQAELDADPASRKLYEEELIPLVQLLIMVMEQGCPVDQAFVYESLDWIPQQKAQAEAIASAYAGFPVSLSSGPQLRSLLDSVEDVFEAAKQLQGFSIKKEITEKGAVSFDKDTVNALRNAFLPVDFNETLDCQLAVERIANGAHPLLEAKALYEGARILLSNYIKPLLIPLTEGEDGCYYYEGGLHVGGGSPAIYFEGAYNG